GQVLVISATILELDVERARHLRERVIASTMHAEGEDPIVVGENGVGAVALVNIEVHDDGPIDAPLGLERTDCDGHIVENAEPFAAVGEGVAMNLAGEIHRDAYLER